MTHATQNTSASKPARRKPPVILQFAQSECGLCSAAMILEYWGYRGAIYELRRNTDPGRDGLGLKDVAAMLTKRGISVGFVRANFQGLQHVDEPFIAFWKGYHLVVVEKLNEHRAVILDPASGRVRISAEKFTESFSGHALLCTPAEHFRPRRDKNYSIRDIWRELATRSYAGSGAKILLLSLLLYAFTLGIPIATKELVNRQSELIDGYPTVAIAVILTLPFVIYSLFGILRTRILARMVAHVGEDLMGGVFKKLLSMPYRFFASRSNGELMTRLSSVNQLRDLVSNQITAVLLDVGVVAFIVGYLVFDTPHLSIVAIGLGVIMVLLTVGTWSQVQRVTDEEIRALGKSTGTQMEAITSISSVKTTGMAPSFYTRWRKDYQGALYSGRRRMLIQGTVATIIGAIQMFGPFLVLAVGIKLLLEGTGTLGEVIAAQSLATMLLASVSSLSLAISQFVKAQVQIARLIDLMTHESDNTWGSEECELSGQMTVDQLSFTYPGAQLPALSEVSFSVDPGEKVAVVGRTGSGKSTLAKVLVGLFPPTAGSITLDGRPNSEMSEESFRRAVAYVPQDIQLSNRQIAENIDFTGEAPDLELVRTAAHIAQISGAIESMPLGYHTEIQEMGANISGGQRQRIAIARAIARRPKMIVLDEATSALDNMTERDVAQCLAELNSAQIVIAHRTSTIRSADRILVLRDGHLVQEGTFSELMAEDGEFRELMSSMEDANATR